MKLGPIVRFTKKMTLNKCGPGSGPNYGETAVCLLGREGNKWPKLRFSLYTPPKRLFPVNYLVKRYFFLWTTLPSRGRNMVRRKKWHFFWQNFRILARKSVFCYRTPEFVNGPFVALGDSFDLAPLDPFFDFSFPSYGNFREGDPPTQQKVLPHLTVGH